MRHISSRNETTLLQDGLIDVTISAECGQRVALGIDAPPLPSLNRTRPVGRIEADVPATPLAEDEPTWMRGLVEDVLAYHPR